MLVPSPFDTAHARMNHHNALPSSRLSRFHKNRHSMSNVSFYPSYLAKCGSPRAANCTVGFLATRETQWSSRLCSNRETTGLLKILLTVTPSL